jgi:hypothetical protein
MRNAKLLALASLVVLSACAAERKHARSSETPIVAESSDKSDMPAAPAEKGTTAEATPAQATPTTESLAIKVVPMKLTPAKKGKTVEVKKDGTITADGKAVAKISGDQIDALDGSGTLVTVSMDGTLVGQAVRPGLKLEGDDLVIDQAVKVSFGDDGAVTSTTKDGKSETLAKVEGGADAKRTAVLITTVLVAKPAELTVAAAKSPAKPAAKKK